MQREHRRRDAWPATSFEEPLAGEGERFFTGFSGLVPGLLGLTDAAVDAWVHEVLSGMPGFEAVWEHQPARFEPPSATQPSLLGNLEQEAKTWAQEIRQHPRRSFQRVWRATPRFRFNHHPAKPRLPNDDKLR